MWIRLLLLCSFATALEAQRDSKDFLQRVRDKVNETVDRLPNFMCTETIDRVEYRPGSRHPRSCGELISLKNEGKPRPSASDRLRLDVAVAAQSEMYSWVGANHFQDKGLTDLVKGGDISAGSFASFLILIFHDNAATFTYSGEKTEGGRRLAEFEFRVPREKSKYLFVFTGGKTLTAYEGTFLADPKTFDLARLSVRTSGLPPETGSCEATTTLDYRRVRLREAEFLLPSETRFQILTPTGLASENRTLFSACHEFLGESTLKFDEAETVISAAEKPAAGPAPQLPAGRAFQLAITQDIDTTTAAAGDPIAAKLTTAIRGRASEMLVPAGAAITGRMVEMRRGYVPESSLSITFRLETLTIGGTSAPFVATVDALGQRLKTTQGGSGVLHWRSSPGVAAVIFDRVKGTEVIKRGQEMKWVTVGRYSEAKDGTP